MKKILVVAIAVVFAAVVAGKANAEETKTKTEVKPTATGTVEKTEVKTTETKVKDTVKTTAATGDVKSKEVVENKEGKVWKDTVTLHKFDKGSDYIYVMKDNKVLRLKHTLSDSDKKIMLEKKPGDTVTITSTYPLTQQELAVITSAK